MADQLASCGIVFDSCHNWYLLVKVVLWSKSFQCHRLILSVFRCFLSFPFPVSNACLHVERQNTLKQESSQEISENLVIELFFWRYSLGAFIRIF